MVTVYFSPARFSLVHHRPLQLNSVKVAEDSGDLDRRWNIWNSFGGRRNIWHPTMRVLFLIPILACENSM